MKEFSIKTPKGTRKIGPGYPVFIIAEMSGNHNHNFKKALKIIDAAAKAGVDAIKLQTYTADTITIDCDNRYFQVKVNKAWKGQTLYSLYKKAYTPWEWQPKLKKYAESKGLICFSTPFDPTAVDFLEKMDVSLYKVASFEVIDIPLLEQMGKTKKPVIMSRGMASLAELKLAIKTLKNNGTPSIAILHCISSYPAAYEEMHLKTIPDIAKKFRTTVGLSDHSLGSTASVTAVALGASVIERHITLSRKDGGPDASFSLEPGEFRELVQSIRKTEKTLGEPRHGAGLIESGSIVFRKSIFAVKDIKKGEKFTTQNIRVIRPGYGLAPRYLDKVLNKKSKNFIFAGTPLKLNLID